MREEIGCEGFRCPEFVPIGAPDDFCIPEECCPERIEQPKMPSPTSCLPEEETIELEERILEINQMLLDLALSEEREPREIFRRAFDGLIGQQVILKLNCPDLIKPKKNMNAKGRVYLVGQDFVILKGVKYDILVPFEQIVLIKHSNRYAEPEHMEQLNEIDPCFRRDLTFNFGAVVSSSPELIQIFFRLTLKIYLLLLVGEKIRVTIDGEKMIGTVCETNDETITLTIKKAKLMKKVKKGKKLKKLVTVKQRVIPLANVCKLVVLK